MEKAIPILRNDKLSYRQENATHIIVAGTPTWNLWLQNAKVFVVEHELGTFTARKERAGNRRGSEYWRAYYRCQGTLHRMYIGKTEEVTLVSLDETMKRLVEKSRVSGEAVTPEIPAISLVQAHRRIEYSRKPVTRTRQQKEKHPPSHRNSPVLLKTKFSVPAVIRPHVIARPRLYQQLEQVVKYKLSLVSASAGFGKTTLLSTWLSTSQKTFSCPVAWLSLDEGDNDSTVFWTYCIAALNMVQQEIGNSALELLSSTQPVSISTVLTVLINALSTLSDHCILVLDDYHFIKNSAIHESMAFFLDHLPPQMHLLLTTRADPDLPLDRLRVRNELLEMRTKDLRFTLQEATEFLQQTMGLMLTDQAFPERLPILHQRASYWYEENDLLREAIEHATIAADVERVALLVEQFFDATIWSYSEMTTLRRWLIPLPEYVIRSRPRLCILQAWLLEYSLGYHAMERDAASHTHALAETYLQNAQQQLASLDTSSKVQAMRGEIAALFSLLFFAKGEFMRVG